MTNLSEDTISSIDSRLLNNLKTKGWTIIDNVLNQEELDKLKVSIDDYLIKNNFDTNSFDGFLWIEDSICWSLEVVKAVVNPSALKLIRSFLGTENIHFCHQPIITVLKPAKQLIGCYPEGGWHSDYPYRDYFFPNNLWPKKPELGVQYNICIDDFKSENGATQFVLGSHEICTPPPEEFNLNGTRPGIGIHKNVVQIEAPAGSAIVYNSKTWHRRCEELNISGKRRIAILNAVAPSWIPPMIDKQVLSKQFARSDINQALSVTEKKEIKLMCNSKTAKQPKGTPKLFKKCVAMER